MKASTDPNTRDQRLGGLSALYLALAYVVAMAYFLLVVDYPGVIDPAQKVALLQKHHLGMAIIHLSTYVIFGIALTVLSMSLYRRMKDQAPILMQIAGAIGLIWAFVLVASGLVFNYGMETVTALHQGDPEQAASIWRVIEPVTDGLGGAGGEALGGLWTLLVSWAAFRTGRLPKTLCWLGMAVGIVGLVSVVPALRDGAMAFGALQIVWLAGIGAVMTRAKARRTNLGRVTVPA